MIRHVNPDPFVMCKKKQVPVSPAIYRNLLGAVLWKTAIAAPGGALEGRRDWSSTNQAYPRYFSHFPVYKVHAMDWSSQEKLFGPLAESFMEDIASLENIVYNADALWEVMASIYECENQASHFYNDQGRKRHGIEPPATLLDTNEGIEIRKVTVVLLVEFHNGANHDTFRGWGDAEWTSGGDLAADSSTESAEDNGIFVCHGRDICACLRPRYEALDDEEDETDCAPHPPLQLFTFMLRKHDELQFVRGAFDRTY
ncbi:hypothetical protein CSHISOI_01287, partial [Colletotrichum shisoi]